MVEVLTLASVACAGVIARVSWRLFPYFVRAPRDLKSVYNAKGNSFAIVTGATEGIGKAFAQTLAKQQMNVILLGRNQMKLDAVQEEILASEEVGGGGGSLICTCLHDLADNPIASIIADDALFNAKLVHAMNTSRSKDVTRLSFSTPPTITLLVNNAGVAIVSEFSKTPPSEITAIINTNAIAPLALSHAMISSFFTDSASSYGIINVSSTMGDFPAGYVSLYAATKRFTSTLHESLSAELPNHIHVMTVAPFYVQTRMTRFQQTSFTTITPQELVDSSLNAFLHRQVNVAGSWKHECVRMAMNAMSRQLVLKKLTENMRKPMKLQEILNKRRQKQEAKLTSKIDNK